jgi:hypothetical protein
MDIRGTRKSDREGLPGRSLRCLVEGMGGLVDRPALMEYDDDWWEGPVFRTRCLIEDRYKLAIISAPGGGGLLFDLETDPTETENLFDDRRFADVKARMLENLVFEMARTDRLIDQRRMVGA